MPLMARMGDIVGPGGVISAGVPSILVNGQPAAFLGAPVTPHACCGAPGCDPHCVAHIVTGAPTILVNGIPAVYVGCMASCADAVVMGAPGVIITG
jgi:uncharacterized Zn-binding protein involved in type VI secretion